MATNYLGIRKWPVEARIAAMSVKSADKDGCWQWVATLNSDGYGVMGHKCKTHLVHRLVYALAHGDIPSGFEVCHRCDNPRCVNPDHLFTALHKENMADMVRKKRSNKCRGEAHGRAKLTATQVKEIRSSNEDNAALAARYGIVPGNIWSIRHRRIWKHVE